MLVIEVELLGGRYAATAYNNRGWAEWPPHPARLFSALVAALHEGDAHDKAEREALLWLERQDPPSLAVDRHVGRREVLDVFVPVNDVSLLGDIDKPLREAREKFAALAAGGQTADRDKALKAATKLIEKEEKKLADIIAAQQALVAEPSNSEMAIATALLPERRIRQARTFPVAFPASPHFAFIWSATAPAPLREALDRLCARVTRLGHSSSLVRCAIMEQPVTPTLVPDPDGDEVLRTVVEGQLECLEDEFARHQGSNHRVLPSLPRRYGRPKIDSLEKEPERSIFSDDWIVFERIDGARLSSSRGTDLAQALRRALIEQHGSATLPAAISGHAEDGAPANITHVAFVALPFVGHEHADGSVQGCAIVMPRKIPDAEREVLLRLVAAWEMRCEVRKDAIMELAGATLPSVFVKRTELPGRVSLRARTWCEPARRFVTATPIALDRNPGNLRSNLDGTARRAALEAQRLIADACERIMLPRPVSVEVSLVPLLPGAQPVREFQPWPGRPGRPMRMRVHADILFPTPVRGPVLLGAGRFFGLGLCLPYAEESR